MKETINLKTMQNDILLFDQMAAAFSSLMTLLYQNFDTTQIYDSNSFRLLSENSMLSFTHALGTINAVNMFLLLEHSCLNSRLCRPF